MKKLLFLLVALSLLWTWQAVENPASAHGGSYRGPAGEVPPGSRDPKDPQPPPENPTTPTQPGGGTPTGPGGGTVTGGDEPPPGESPRPTNPAPAGPTGPSIGGAATPGGKVNRPKPMSFENWLFWWNYNKDEILNLKAALKAREKKVSTKSSAHFFGAGDEKNRSDTQAPTEAMIQKDVIPNLQKVIANKEIHPDIRGGAVIALARAGGIAHVADILEMAKVESDEDKLVQESAIVAIGILQLKNEDIRKFLVDFIDNKDAPWRARCFAAISLGLLKDNSPEVFACLERRLDGRESTPDVPICALLAMGLIGDNTKVPQLVEWLDAGRIGKNRLGDLEKAYLVGAIGKIADPEGMKAVEGTLRKKGTLTRRSAMIAFGQILPNTDEDTQQTYVKKLAAYVKNESDTTAKNFGIISLGRIAGENDAPDSVRKMALALLLDQFKNGGKTTERPYAALALGLVGLDSNPDLPKPKELKYQIAEPLRQELKDPKGDKVSLGALAIALGMVGDQSPETVQVLVDILEDRGENKKLRGASAVALGLIGDTSASEPIMKALEEREDRDLRVDTAVAAGLLGDSQAVTKLVTILNDPRASQFVLGSVALALGQIGDSKAIPDLLEVLEPEKANGTYPDLTRALVAVALGQLSNRRDLRVLFNLSKDINYRASASAVEEILTIL